MSNNLQDIYDHKVADFAKMAADEENEVEAMANALDFMMNSTPATETDPQQDDNNAHPEKDFESLPFTGNSLRSNTLLLIVRTLLKF